jgi:hypothetical protein
MFESSTPDMPTKVIERDENSTLALQATKQKAVAIWAAKLVSKAQRHVGLQQNPEGSID